MSGEKVPESAREPFRALAISLGMQSHARLALTLTLFLAGCGTGGRKAAPAVVESDGISPSFTFESGPVRPLALSPDGNRLFVSNTPNASLDIFEVTGDGLVAAGSVYVGLDPVAVAARDDHEVWVVNQISDSVSIVDVAAMPPRVTRTLLVGDEPSDVVFAGADKSRRLRHDRSPRAAQERSVACGRSRGW